MDSRICQTSTASPARPGISYRISFRRSDLDAVFAAVSGRNQVKKIDTRTVVNQFKRSFDEATLNALGKRARLCRRERVVTPPSPGPEHDRGVREVRH